jgi:hypothetical protein
MPMCWPKLDSVPCYQTIKAIYVSMLIVKDTICFMGRPLRMVLGKGEEKSYPLPLITDLFT